MPGVPLFVASDPEDVYRRIIISCMRPQLGTTAAIIIASWLVCYRISGVCNQSPLLESAGYRWLCSGWVVYRYYLPCYLFSAAAAAALGRKWRSGGCKRKRGDGVISVIVNPRTDRQAERVSLREVAGRLTSCFLLIFCCLFHCWYVSRLSCLFVSLKVMIDER